MKDIRGLAKAEWELRRRKYHDMNLLRWDGLNLRLKTGRLLAVVEPDAKYPGMYRVRTKDGHLTDMVNLSRAKDAARSLAIASLNRDAGLESRRGHVGAQPTRSFHEAAE